MTTPRAKSSFFRRLRRWCLALALVIAFFGGILLVAAWMMIRQSPGWWRQIDPADPAVVRAAEEIENDLVNEFHRADRPADAATDARWASEPWALALSAPGANAWLNTRLRPWLENQYDDFSWPEDLLEIQVDFDAGRIVIGLRIRRGREESQVLAARFVPRIPDDGSLWVQVERVYLGRLPMPADWVLGDADQRLSRLLDDAVDDPGELAALTAALAGRSALLDEPVVRLGDGRRVRVLSIRADRGLLEIICRTELE
ncbi:MAG: hypothetical protein KF866_07000 [Phycisphaeraceae bacterium]|nr:hypothetical protein [Phycisphaeraceae bacterium]MCW5755407.1 hypothetical protein [Phycisphaeraceae bacterium]